jgi:tRNA (cmo5U34)-methyltransferase
MSLTKSSVGHKPDGKWAFDQNVTQCFDDMLARSIPDYAAMRRLVFDLGSRFVQDRTAIIDLGCSRGDGLAPFLDRFGACNRYVAIDESGPMLAACRERFAGWLDNGVLEVRQHDLRAGLPALMPASLILSVLTIQFTPIELRQRIVADSFRVLRGGGAVVIVEKVLGPDAAGDRLLVDSYYDLKRANGYSSDDIDAKRVALQGVLVPQTAEANEQMLRAEGFRVVPFWRSLNFAGWLAIKPKGASN